MANKLNILSDNKNKESQTKKKRFRPGEKSIPYLILAGFILVMILLFGEQLIPAEKVEIIPVVSAESNEIRVSEASIEVRDAKALFQASGWVEADPYAYRAVALVNGVIDEVKVLEGELVKKGQLIATLIDDDVQLDLRTAQNEYSRLQAEQAAHEIEIEISKAAIQTIDSDINAELARVAELEDLALRNEGLDLGIVSEEDIIQAQLKLKTAEADLQTVRSKKNELLLYRSKLETKNLSTKAALAKAKTDVDRKLLALERTQISSPIDGRIQSLHASPGDKKMMGADDHDSITVAVIYDPENLQTRIDIPLEEAAKLQVGQSVSIRTNLLADKRFKGIVTRIVGESDLQRNTLQAKVKILNPDSRLRPEMLCRAEFFPYSNPSDASGKKLTTGVQVYVPESAIAKLEGTKAVVYKLSQNRKRAEKLILEVQPENKNGFYAALSALKPGDQLINKPSKKLNNNQRVSF